MKVARRPARSRAVPLYQLRDPEPIRLRPTLWTWFREFGNLLGGVVLVLAAAYLWRFLPW